METESSRKFSDDVLREFARISSDEFLDDDDDDDDDNDDDMEENEDCFLQLGAVIGVACSMETQARKIVQGLLIQTSLQSITV